VGLYVPGNTPLTATLNGVTATGPVTTTYGDDGDGHQTSVTSANGATTTAYDHLSRQVSTTLPRVTLYDGGSSTPTSAAAYDGDGNVAQVERPNGDTVYYLYDLSDRPISTQIDPSAVTKGQAQQAPTYETFAYDAAGNGISHTDADNRTVQDVATTPGPGRTTTITTTTTFDPDGNTLSWTRQTQPPTGPVQTQTDSATYDAADRQASATDNGLTTHYGYDSAGQLRTHTIADGATLVTTTLDPEGRETAISEGMGGSGPYTGRLGYNLNDLPITMTLPGGVAEGMGYDASSRLVTETLAGPRQQPCHHPQQQLHLRLQPAELDHQHHHALGRRHSRA